VLGAVLAHRVTKDITTQLAAAGVPTSGSGGSTSALNLTQLPPAVKHIIRAAYGDATGHIFLISAVIAVVGVIAAFLMRPTALRTTVDIQKAASETRAAEDEAQIPAFSGTPAAGTRRE
jgi:hypothetical protein